LASLPITCVPSTVVPVMVWPQIIAMGSVLVVVVVVVVVVDMVGPVALSLHSYTSVICLMSPADR
jgi:hypothetical protein